MLDNTHTNTNTAHEKHLPFFQRLSFFFQIVIFLIGFSPNAFGQVFIPLSELNSAAMIGVEAQGLEIGAVSDRLFVSTNEGLWTIRRDGKVNKIGGYTPVLTEYPGQLLVEAVGDQVFVAASGGTWIIGNDDQAVEVKGLEGFLLRVEELGGRLWVQTWGDLWSVDQDGRVNRVESIQGKVQVIAVAGGQLFVVTDEGLQIVGKDGGVRKVEAIRGPNIRLLEISDQVFVRTGDACWIVDQDGNPTRLEGVAGGRGWLSVKPSENQLFIAYPGGLWIANKTGSATEVKDVDMKSSPGGNMSYFVELINGHLFVAAPKGFWIVSQEGKATEVQGLEGSSFSNSEIVADRLLFGTEKGLWSISIDGKATKFEIPRNSIESIEAVGSYIYVKTSETLYQFDPGVKINTKLIPTGWWAILIGHVLPSTWLPAGKVQATASYSDEVRKNPYHGTIPNEFRFAKAHGNLMPSDDKFSTLDQFNYDIGWGNNEIHYWVKDKWGNTFEQKTLYRGVPSQYFTALLPFLFSALFVLGCFALAPKVNFCHSAIMNPWLRRYFSLGSVPLLLSVFPSLRRHVLQRYSNAVGKDNEFAEWKTRFVSPDEEFLPENFGKKLNDERRLLLTGQSGIGKTSFFKYLTAYYSSNNNTSHPAKVFPVYIPLTNYGGKSLEELVYTQLFSYGTITDKELAPMFLEHGGLVIFLDGVNEVQNVADRQALSEFVKKFGASNYFCISSQQTYPEIENIPKVELKTLSKEKVHEFIRQRVNDKNRAESVIKELTDQDYQLYSVPRDLEFVIEVLNSGQNSLPKSRTELYRTVFTSIFANWTENRNLDAESALCRRAYKMIAERELAFDSVDNPTFDTTTELYEQRFLVRREKNYNFRHDLIRSYLASEYFYPRWPNLLGAIGGKQIDSNWLEMLKFASEYIEDPDEVKSLVFEVLNKSVRKDLVKNLFEWLKANHPSKCQSWESEFYSKYGKLDFR